MKQAVDVGGKKIVVFKNGKNAYVDGYTKNKYPFLSDTGSVFYEYSCRIINKDSGKKDEDVDWYEVHIENAT